MLLQQTHLKVTLGLSVVFKIFLLTEIYNDHSWNKVFPLLLICIRCHSRRGLVIVHRKSHIYTTGVSHICASVCYLWLTYLKLLDEFQKIKAQNVRRYIYIYIFKNDFHLRMGFISRGLITGNSDSIKKPWVIRRLIFMTRRGFRIA